MPAMICLRCYLQRMAYPLTTAQTHLDDLADLEDRAALAAHLADKAADRGGITLDELDAALDRIDAETLP
jgi:hypothetical protein